MKKNLFLILLLFAWTNTICTQTTPYEGSILDCIEFEAQFAVDIDIPSYFNINCGTLPEMEITVSSDNPDLYKTLILRIWNSMYNAPSYDNNFFLNGTYQMTDQLVPDDDLGPYPKKVVYYICITDKLSGCTFCKDRTVFYHEGYFAPINNYSVIESNLVNGCAENNFITYDDLVGSVDLPTGGNTSDNVLLCCNNSFSAGVEYSFNVNATFTGNGLFSILPGVEIGGSVAETGSINLMPANTNGCSYFSIAYREDYYEGIYFEFVDDCSEEYTIEEFTYTIPSDHTVVPCNIELGSPCNTTYDLIPTHPNPSGDSGGSINIEIDNPELIYEIEWSGPDGFSSSSFDIEDLSAGEYCVDMTNQCCEEFSSCIILCPDISYGNWYYDAGTMQYCREAYCPGVGLLSPADTNDLGIFIECINEWQWTYGPWSFDLGTQNCKRDVLFDGVLIDVEQKPAEVLEYYDENVQLCIREYRCGEEDTPSDFSQFAGPIFGIWMFDPIADICFREITCFGTLLSDQQDEQAADIQWTYDEFSGQCIGTPYCNGLPAVTSPPIYQFPINPGFWQYDFATGECYRLVQCDIDINSQVEHREDATLVWGFDLFSDQCVGIPHCDGFPVPGALPVYQFPSSQSTWNLTTENLTCSKTVYCGNPPALIWVETSADLVSIGTNSAECGEGIQAYQAYCDGYNTGEVFCGSALQSENGSGTNFYNHLVRVSPNPFNQQLSISLFSEQEQSIEISLTDLSGRLLFNQQLFAQMGTNEFSLADFQQLPSGLFFLTISSEDKQINTTQKVTKQ